MLAVIKKELKSYLLSPLGYVFIGAFLLMFSIFFYVDVFKNGLSNFEYIFYSGVTVLTFVTPVLTMRMFSEERKTGTEQLLLTSPISLSNIVLGKFLAAGIIIALTEVASLMYLGIIAYFGTPDLTIALVTLLGFLLLGLAYISLGMFISSITENQIISCVLTIGILIAMWLLPSVNDIFSYFSLVYMFDKFPSGIISLSEVVALISFTVLFILLTIIILQRRKSVK